MSNGLQDRMDFVVFGENSWRLKLRQYQWREPDITYNAHGQTVPEARRTIRNIINICRSPLHLVIIHGFNRGTAIKEMLAEEDFSDRLISRFSPDGNPGATIMNIAA